MLLLLVICFRSVLLIFFFKFSVYMIKFLTTRGKKKKGNPRASKQKKVPSLIQNQQNKNESTMENHLGKQFAII